MKIEIGMSGTASAVVDDASLATACGSGEVGVYATPAMVALMEAAAVDCLDGALGEGCVTVGTAITVEHTAATPPGHTVTATASVTGVEKEGRVLRFNVAAYDEAGPIGAGTHARAVVNRARFEEKARAKERK